MSNFLEDPQNQENCKNFSVTGESLATKTAELQESNRAMLLASIEYLEGQICLKQKESKEYTDEEVAKLQIIIDQNKAAIETLTNGQATAEQLAAINSLLENVDFNSDGQVEELATLFQKINDAVDKIDGFESRIDAVEELNAQQTAQITSLGETVAAANTKSDEAKASAQEAKDAAADADAKAQSALDSIANLEPTVENYFNKFVDRDVFKTKIKNIIVEEGGISEERVIELITQHAVTETDEDAVRLIAKEEAEKAACTLANKIDEINEAHIAKCEAEIAANQSFIAALTSRTLSCPVEEAPNAEGDGLVL